MSTHAFGAPPPPSGEPKTLDPQKLERESFWELHRRLGEAYEAELARRRLRRSSAPTRPRSSSRPTAARPAPSRAPSLPTKIQSKDTSSDEPLMLAPQASSDAKESFFKGVDSREVGMSIAEEMRNYHQDDEDETEEEDVPQELGKPPASVVADPALLRVEEEPPIRRALRPHECWTQCKQTAGTGSVQTQMLIMAGTTRSVMMYAQEEGSQVFGVLDPAGQFRTCWDLVAILLLLTDVVLIPLQFLNLTYSAESQLAVGFWILDLVLNFRTAYVGKGVLVRNGWKVAWNYLRTWFLFDFGVVLLDAILEFGEEGRATRFLRCVRLLRAARLGPVSKLYSFLQEKLDSQVAALEFSLCLLLLCLVLLEHVIACGWFGVTALGQDETWIQHFNMGDKSMLRQYTSSMTWSLAQLGVGSTEVEAVSEVESVYTVGAGFVSVLCFAMVVSALTSLVRSLHVSQQEEKTQFRQLRQFLWQNQIPTPLGKRVTRYLRYANQEAAVSRAADRPAILEKLSVPLIGELLFTKHKRSLGKLPFLNRLVLETGEISLQENYVLHHLSVHAISILDLGEGEMVFSAGEAADRSFLPQSGHFQYMRLQRSSSPVDKTFWIAEMCLWTPWSYTGDLVSGDFSRLAVLDAKGFRECVAAVPQMQSQAHFYAQGYVDALNEEQDKSDVWFFGIVGQASLLSRPSASPSFAAAAAGASAVAKAVGDGAQTLKVRCCCRRRPRKKKSKKPKAVVPTP